MKLFCALIALSALTGCAYQIGHHQRSLPGGHTTVFVELFDNNTKDLGAEVSFTQALNRELERSGFAIVTSPSMAEVIIKGTVLSALSRGGGLNPNPFFDEDNANQNRTRLSNTTNFTQYTLIVVTSLKAVRSRDETVIWQTTVRGSKAYSGAALTKQGVRSSNVLYNQSRRKQTMKLLAVELMEEAFDRLTENF